MNNLLIGLVIFVIGLSKKLLIADQIALYIDPYFSLDPAQLKVSTLESWFAAIGYIFQLYFDFSGYSDMAVGICKCIGLNIPYNFDSPLKKKSIQAFWNTWHITLTRFTTNYIFNSLVIFLNKFKLNLNLIIISSSMMTFILIGVWHGSGLNFLIFGLIHGFAYQINRFFIYIINNFQLNFFKTKYFDIFYWVITFIVIVVSFVFFRSPNLEISLAIVSNMFNFSNIILPNLFSKVVLINEIFELIGFKFGSFSFFTDFSFLLLLTTCFVILIFFPNTKEISILFENDLINDKSSKKYSIIKLAIFSIFIGTILISSLFSLRNYNVFLYYQF